jgi:8-amino-7-oxononanoate synthase
MSLAPLPIAESLEFGSHLLHSGLVSWRQLKTAIEQLQQRPFLHLGEMLCLMGMLDEDTVARSLDAYNRAPHLGHLLMARGSLSLDQLVEALTIQAHGHAPLGEILVTQGFLEPEELRMALEEQQAAPASGDVFAKVSECPQIEHFLEARRQGDYPFFTPLEASESPRTRVDGKSVILLASNSYLGLSDDPEVKEAAIAAIRQYGVGTSGSPMLNGTMDLHVDLERALADFMGFEACALFSTGFQTNIGLLSALAGRSDVVLVDSLAHASLHDGARLSYAQVKRFRHNDLDHLEAQLKEAGPRGKLIVVDGVYSMDGDLADLPGIARLAKLHGARILLDDAHGFGVLGRHGRGTAEYFGLLAEVDVIMLTFSKSLGCIGGCVLAAHPVIDYLKHRSRPFIFSATMPPGTAAAAHAALRRIQTDPSLRLRLESNVKYMRRKLFELGFDLGETPSHILPVRIGPEATTVRVGRELLDEGVLVGTVVSPGVPLGQARLRLSLMASHSLSELTLALEALERVAARHGLIPAPRS